MKNKIPAPGGAVESDAPRPQITQMLAPESDKDFEESFPDSTANPQLPLPEKRKRRTRAEMEAARANGEVTSGPATKEDERLEKCKRKFAAMGGGRMVKAGVGRLTPEKPLDKQEQEDVDDYFYMVAAKGGIDPMKNWFTMWLTLFCLLLQLVLSRTEMFDKLKDILFPEKKKAEKSQGEGEEVAA